MERRRLPRGPLGDFLKGYAKGLSPAELRVERDVHGINAGITSYTTPAQARALADVLRLGPGVSLLDIGAGAGWPGVFLAARTGCRAFLSDVPVDGLRAAAARANDQGVFERCSFVAASGDRLPFRARAFDAVVHTDVL
jgi:ubiquinone/menaquinone biosynthesis C-methylase UbiE